MAMPAFDTRDSNRGRRLFFLLSAQASSAQESSDIPERYRRQVAPTPEHHWQSPALHDYTRALKSTEAP